MPHSVVGGHICDLLRGEIVPVTDNTSQNTGPIPRVWVGGGGGSNYVSTMPGCVCRKVKDVGPFLFSSE